MSLRSRRSRRSSSAPTPSRYGVHCAACNLGPAAFTASSSEAHSWAAAHNQMFNHGANGAVVKSS
ncbi:hypothetical protein AB1484_22975 [Parafrankia sp. FMc6]|uniref:hypothetical protein n=1 Tax=Parafrankia soli TaxID=2599596 RepID=UPI0034D51B77